MFPARFAGRRLLLAAAVILFACDEDPVVPMGGGSIVLNVITDEPAHDAEGVGTFSADGARR